MGIPVNCQVFIVLPPMILPSSSASIQPVENGSDGDARSLGDIYLALFQE